MAVVVLDASALLAFLFREPGMDRVRETLPDSVMSSVNLAEVITTAIRRGGKLPEIVDVLAQLPMKTLPFDSQDAIFAVSLYPVTKEMGLSLADRCCLALGARLGVPVLTADTEWAGLNIGVQVEAIR
jgi:PIN domain nuclease of toxin-antitoxin system